jgi:LCP family protein required for cell wall assembly
VADPGAQATLEAVSGTLGLTVQAYVLVDMEGFSTLIDAMGGIRIKAGGWVPMSGYFDEFSRTYGMPLGWIPAGEQTLDGNQALWYGRSREYVDDYARIQRQQCVQQAMLKQLDPATLLSKFEDIVNAGTQVVESNISSTQLGSFVDLAIKARGQDVKRLTIGPPDFDASFSTVPDFDQIHVRVDELLASASSAQSLETPDDEIVVPAAGGGSVQAAGAYVPTASLLAGGGLPQQPAPSDFIPVTTTPDGEPITEELLNQLKREGNEQAIAELVATNGQCAAL